MKSIDIRLLEVKDAKDYASSLNHQEVVKHLSDSLPYPYLEEDALDLIQSMDKESIWLFGIEYNDKLVGGFHVKRLSSIEKYTCEITYHLLPDYANKGIGFKAILLLLGYIYKETNLVRIQCKVFQDNLELMQLLEKVGFKFEGRLRASAFKNNRIIDMRLYSLIREEIKVK